MVQPDDSGPAAVIPGYSAGEIVPSIDSVYSLADVPTALRRFGEASQNGKIIVRMP
jgi:NADPH:quinone reductase-like Zn-dependent oxidoreductase